jgi:F0F1-type ATP synthase membrane subunit c/vacuolar-type H+-ATPase subunit K
MLLMDDASLTLNENIMYTSFWRDTSIVVRMFDTPNVGMFVGVNAIVVGTYDGVPCADAVVAVIKTAASASAATPICFSIFFMVCLSFFGLVFALARRAFRHLNFSVYSFEGTRNLVASSTAVS